MTGARLMVHQLRRMLTVFILSCLTAACAATADGPAFEPLSTSSGGGVIYVYALDGFGGYGESPIILVDGEEVGRLEETGYIAVPASTGTHTVAMRAVLASIPFPSHEYEVTLSGGGSAYFRIVRKYDGSGYSGGAVYAIYVNDFHPVSDSVGRAEIAQTRQSGSAN